MNASKLMCLTTDGIERSHLEQVRALCAAGADWIQLRMKAVDDDTLEGVARECLALCREAGCRFVVNDRIEVALRIGADGVHLGQLDCSWSDARALAGPDFMIGGTVNSLEDAARAVTGGALDYVGVGPFRFTHTKKNLAPVLSSEQWRRIVEQLGELPSYAIGGIEAEDLAAVHQLGVSGAAVCSVLYRNDTPALNYARLLRAWPTHAPI